MVTTKQHLMAMLVLCQDPVIRQFSEVNIVILIFIVEEMAVQTLKMSGCKIQGSVYLKIVLVNDWVVEVVLCEVCEELLIHCYITDYVT